MYFTYLKDRLFTYLSECIFSVLLAAFGAAVYLLRELRRRLADLRAQSWPTANATITTTDVKTFHGRFCDYAVGTIGYSYNINGSYYAGYFSHQSFDEQRAWTFVDARKDKQALIRYKPSRPEISILRKGDQYAWQVEIPSEPIEWIPLWLTPGKKHWPTTRARVQSVKRQLRDYQEGGDYIYEAVFTYSVNGEPYSNVARFHFLDMDLADQEVTIHYDASAPSRSVLFLDEQRVTEETAG